MPKSVYVVVNSKEHGMERDARHSIVAVGLYSLERVFLLPSVGLWG